MYELDFSCSSIFHQLWTHIGYIKGKKVRLIFHSFLAHFSPPGRLPNATTTPWKVFLSVSWQSTFQLGPRKAPKPLVAKIKFWAPKPERGLNHYPIKKLSPLCTRASYITCDMMLDRRRNKLRQVSSLGGTSEVPIAMYLLQVTIYVWERFTERISSG